MTVDKWRNKRWNRRCEYCVHLGSRGVFYGVCKAKKKAARLSCPRLFCRIFELRRYNEMTDKERLIKLLKTKYDHYCDQCGVNKDSHYIENLADYLIANGVTLHAPLHDNRASVQNWIPVTERMPEIGVPVLVTYRNAIDGTPRGDGVAAQLFGKGCWYWWEGSEDDCDCEVAVEITHWMPLPEPPEEMEKIF